MGKSMTMIEDTIASLKETLAAIPPRVSFEFFPPKTAEMEEKLWHSISKLAPLNPHFVSVTYGAGGSTRERTHSTVKRILSDTTLKPAAHLTCVGTSRAEMDEIAQGYWDMGVRHIVALRGDAPEGSGTYQPHPDGYAYASDLVAGLKKIGDFEISVAAYPDKHPEAASLQDDIDHLKRKIDAGANRAITQYFFDTGTYLDFLEKAAKNNITVPIIPGILPVTNFKQLVSFSAKCGTTIPKWMENLFAGLDDDPQTRQLVAAIVAVEQCRSLRQAGIEEFHFYTLNRSDLTQAICHILGIRG
jgi:methylenetetrahydrofolate reductase (NADPH)